MALRKLAKLLFFKSKEKQWENVLFLLLRVRQKKNFFYFKLMFNLIFIFQNEKKKLKKINALALKSLIN